MIDISNMVIEVECPSMASALSTGWRPISAGKINELDDTHYDWCRNSPVLKKMYSCRRPIGTDRLNAEVFLFVSRAAVGAVFPDLNFSLFDNADLTVYFFQREANDLVVLNDDGTRAARFPVTRRDIADAAFFDIYNRLPIRD